jgi:outer membrane protein assembly factor BamB
VVRWQAELGRMVNASPVVADGVVYIGSVSQISLTGGALHAVDATTGEELWHLSTEDGDGFFASATVFGGMVYVGSYYGIVIAADATTGEERWRFAAEAATYSSPAVVGGVLYLGDNAGNIYALDAATGDLRWRFAPDNSYERYINSSPAVVDGTVYAVSGARRVGRTTWLHAIDAASGEERWHFAADEGDRLVGTPAVAAGIAYVVSRGGVLYAVDAGSGEERWRFDSGSPAAATNVAVVDGVAYFGTDGDLHALDATSGDERWSQRLSRHGDLDTSPTVADEIVYVADSNGVQYAVDVTSGDERWHLDVGTTISTAVIVGGLVYVGSNTGVLVAIGDPVDNLA